MKPATGHWILFIPWNSEILGNTGPNAKWNENDYTSRIWVWKRLPMWYPQLHIHRTVSIWISMRKPWRHTKPTKENDIIAKPGFKKSRSQNRFSFQECQHSYWVSSLPQTVPPPGETFEVLSRRPQARRSFSAVAQRGGARPARQQLCPI